MKEETRRVLATDPFSRGFGFAVLEGPTRLVDWGLAITRGDKNTKALERLAWMVNHYRPDVIIIEKLGKSRHSVRVTELLKSVRAYARGVRIKTVTIPWSEVRAVMSRSGPSTKEGIAQTVCRLFPELAPHLPAHRKPWMSEDCRMQIFDAAALAVTFFYSRSLTSD